MMATYGRVCVSWRSSAGGSAIGVCTSCFAGTAWLNRRGASELDDRFGLRLDRISTSLSRIERDGHILLETLALFVRFELSIQAPLAENDQAGRAMAAKRFEALRAAVTQRFNILIAGGTSSGKTTLANALLAEMTWVDARVILIEDTRELQCPLAGHAGAWP